MGESSPVAPGGDDTGPDDGGLASPAHASTDAGCWTFDCETATAIEEVLIAQGIRRYRDEGSYSAQEWARRVIRDVQEALSQLPPRETPDGAA